MMNPANTLAASTLATNTLAAPLSPICRIHHIAALTLLLLYSLIGTGCGILAEADDVTAVRYNYPSDFGEFLRQNDATADYEDLVYFLASQQLHDIVPVWQLLQQGSDWQTHALPKYAMPDRELWPKMVNTLVFLKYDLLPYIGPVKVMSGFRNPDYNRLAGGAGKSRHLRFSALDLKPVQEIDRSQLHAILQNRWHTMGKDYTLGLGLYSGLRFHIDTGGYRQW